MTVDIGTQITIDIEKPVAGGRMLARHDGQVVLVWGAIPGERVRAVIQRVGRGVLYAETSEVLSPSADRREAGPDWRCGGNVFAHIGYERQLHLKAEIIRETLGRIGHVPLQSPPDVMASPERGYRMRARLHARGGRLGFFREGTHQLCDAGATGQFLPETVEWIAAVARLIGQGGLAGLAGMEISENMGADERACHLELEGGTDAARFTVLADAGPITGLSAGRAGSLTGLSAERADRAGVERLVGTPSVTDVLLVRAGDPSSAVRLRRDVRSFFQGNRFLLETLVRHVVGLVPPGPVVDLYAGVGLFGLSLAAVGREDITLVEGDATSGADLEGNAEPFGTNVTVDRRSVESYLAGPLRGTRPTYSAPGGTLAASPLRQSPVGRVPRSGPAGTAATFIVDPPRTGISKEAMVGIVEWQPARIIYVSCDIATLARDTRALLDAGYELGGVTGLDLFPNTAHVETVATFSRPETSTSV